MSKIRLLLVDDHDCVAKLRMLFQAEPDMEIVEVSAAKRCGPCAI
jgi:hypothetical protein